MRNFILILTILLTPTLCFAQITGPYVPLSCDAKLPTATDYSIGKDSGGKPCYKLIGSKGFRIFHTNGETIYHSDIDADIIVLGENYIILRKASKDTAWFDRKFIIGWAAN